MIPKNINRLDMIFVKILHQQILHNYLIFIISSIHRTSYWVKLAKNPKNAQMRCGTLPESIKFYTSAASTASEKYHVWTYNPSMPTVAN